MDTITRAEVEAELKLLRSRPGKEIPRRQWLKSLQQWMIRSGRVNFTTQDEVLIAYVPVMFLAEQTPARRRNEHLPPGPSEE